MLDMPPAQQLSNSLSELKSAPQYAESIQAQTGERMGEELTSLRRQVHDLQAAKEREIQHLQSRVEEVERELQQKNDTIQTRENELRASERLVAQLQQSMEQQDKTIRDLQQIMSATASSGQLQQLPLAAEIPQATATATQKDITKLRWKAGEEAPEGMLRGAAVEDGNTIYINSFGSYNIYSCQITSEKMGWCTLPRSHYMHFSLAVIHNLLTCVGGHTGGENESCKNTLHSLTGDSSKRQWSEVFLPMPTARSDTASVTTEHILVVAGGWDGRENLNTVEVMKIDTKQWTTVEHLPHLFGVISGTICGDSLYLGGGYVGVAQPSQSVLTCSLDDLLISVSLPTKPGVWRKINEVPVTRSTLATLGGHLLAIGGERDSHSPIADVHCYDHQSDSWHVVSKMKNERYQSLSAVLPGDQLFIVGGWGSAPMTSIEIGSLPVNEQMKQY